MQTADHHEPMLRVSRDRPCLVCGKPDWCLVREDGRAAICQRIEVGSMKRVGEAGWLHILDDRRSEPHAVRWAPSPPSKTPRDWSAYQNRVREDGLEHLNDLAAKLGVSRGALEQLGTGYDLSRRWWTFPERDAAGTIMGILGRNAEGAKRRLPGSRCGLCYPQHWDDGKGPVLLVEGPSDLAAVLSMGLTGIGRPSNTGGATLLTELLSELSPDRRIIVIGERDQKPDGAWPGRAGAISTATQLAAALEREMEWSLPPDNAKDTRAWLQSVATISPHRWGNLYLDGLNPALIPPPVRYRYQPTSTPTVDLSDWRAAMLDTRIASLGVPGYYLDASPTGAGKSFVELQLVQHVWQGRRP